MFWVATSLIFIMEGVIPAFTSQTQTAIDGITHLGYPVYFAGYLAFFKVLGSLVLIIPKVPGRIKEWAYAGFGIDFISATVSWLFVEGLNPMALLPAAFMVILVISYVSYHKMNGTYIIFEK